jgi:hypothetical protein
MPELPLLEGQYTLSVAVVNDTDTVTYDYHDRAYNFRVAYSPQDAGYGMVQLHGQWQMDSEIDSKQEAGKQEESKPERSRPVARPLSGANTDMPHTDVPHTDVSHSNGTKA